MKTKTLFIIIIVLAFTIKVISQTQDKPKSNESKINDTIKLNSVIINAVRTDVPLKEIPASISVVTSEQLNSFQKTIAADEALRLVPGIKVDNGTGGSRVHLYMRGQGVLSERGFRGIQVLIDGIPVNDPGGYCPDLYDVDWKTVKRVEVVKGLAASTYGGAANGGIVNIITNDGGEKPIGGMLYASAGSYGFWKILGQIDGTQGNINYRISYSHMQGFGYRIHQAFLGDNFSEKINWTPNDKIKITQLFAYTNYFNQNSEGINLDRYEKFGPQAANTDAIPWNEFQHTKRLTAATIGKFTICKNQDVQLKGFFRFNSYRETSNRSDDYRPYFNPGVSAQYNLHFGKENLRNNMSLGGDYFFESMNIHNFAVAGKDTNRVDSHFSKTCFDSNVMQINEIIYQKSAGIFFINKLDISKKFFATLNVRYDYTYNQLNDNLNKDTLNLSGSKEYEKPTYRFGVAYDICKSANVYANYGTGFLAPSNDELFNNPSCWGGFNSKIKPTSTQGEELGLRGDAGKNFHYDITGFIMNSKDEFYRYRVAWMGNTSDVYGNVGKSKRQGIETFISFSPVKSILFEIAYTYSDFRYVSPDSMKDHFIPQCPQHILDADVSLKINKNLTLSLHTEYQSKWYVQVNDSIYETFHEYGTTERNSWVPGFNIYSANLCYAFSSKKVDYEISFFAKNILDEHYFGFTEPNDPPDFNSYQPAPGREFFVSLKLRF
ncbi:MAG: TonB-dependent receptor [Bacteroidales bacterium]|nr:TonB-dependent receptor [Bacteroidales bacterium]